MSCRVVPPTDIAMSDPQTLGWLFVLPQAEFQTLQLIIDVEGYILSSCPYLLFLNLFCCSAPVIGAMLSCLHDPSDIKSTQACANL